MFVIHLWAFNVYYDIINVKEQVVVNDRLSEATLESSAPSAYGALNHQPNDKIQIVAIAPPPKNEFPS